MFHTAAAVRRPAPMRRGSRTSPRDAAWDIEPGGRYYTCRNASSVVAWGGGLAPDRRGLPLPFSGRRGARRLAHVQAQEQRASGGARGRSTPERRALRGHDRLHVVSTARSRSRAAPSYGSGAAWRAGSWRLTARSRSSRASPCTSTAASTGASPPIARATSARSSRRRPFPTEAPGRSSPMSSASRPRTSSPPTSSWSPWTSRGSGARATRSSPPRASTTSCAPTPRSRGFWRRTSPPRSTCMPSSITRRWARIPSRAPSRRCFATCSRAPRPHLASPMRTCAAPSPARSW